MKIHILDCGTVRLAKEGVYGGQSGVRGMLRQSLAPARDRVELPVHAFLIEHSEHGLILIDTGIARAVSPQGVRDPKAARTVFGAAPEALYQPMVAPGQTAREQLAAMGIRPEDLDLIILTHLDPDHTSGLHELRGAKRIVVPEDEYFFTCRAVYKARQPMQLWEDMELERVFYYGSPLGPRREAADLFGDESLLLINLAGHTDGQAAVKLQQGRDFVLFTADAAFVRENWEQGLVPGFCFDPGMMKKGLDFIREQSGLPGCKAVLSSHDGEVYAGQIFL